MFEFNAYFQSGLDQLEKEINAYDVEKELWLLPEGINNSAGNLCFHLLGNLNHFIGAALGKSDYVRDREREFVVSDIGLKELSHWIERTRQIVESSLNLVEDYSLDYPGGYFKEEGTIHFQLLRLLVHFNYHLGQINYHRRLLANQS